MPELEQESLAAFGLEQRTRRLLGQPEMLLNVQLTYDNDAWGTSAGLFYNLVGETLVTGAARGGGDGVPDVFDEEQATLDLTFSQELNERFSIGLRGKNAFRASDRSIYRTPAAEEAIKSERDTPSLWSLSGRWKW